MTENRYPTSVLDRWIAKKHLEGSTAREQLETWQLEKLRELLIYVKKHSPYYAGALEGLALPECLEAFQKYPTMDAEVLREQGMKLLCVSQREISRVVSLDTSGTQAAPKRIFFTQQDQELTVDFFHYGMEELVSKGGSAAVLLPWKSEGCVGDLLIKGLTRLGVQTCGVGIVKNLREAAEQLVQAQAETAVGIPVQILALMEYTKASGIPFPVKKVLLSTDRLPKAVRKRLEDGEIQVFNHFGMTECGLGAALECRAHEGMHVRENDLYLEILDEKGRQVPDGTWGELTVTTLTRKGMPLIRYRSGDCARFLPGLCSCGSMLKRLDEVPGRFGEERGFGQSMEQWDEALFSIPGVVDYRMDVDDKKGICLKIDVIGRDTKAVRQQVLEQGMIEEHGGFQLQCGEIKEELPPYEGKRRIRRRKNAGTDSPRTA